MIDQKKIKQILKSYKSNQASKYIPVRGDEILTKVFDCEKYSISTKYDGHLCFMVKDKSGVHLLNFNGEPFERKDFVTINTEIKRKIAKRILRLSWLVNIIKCIIKNKTSNNKQ